RPRSKAAISSPGKSPAVLEKVQSRKVNLKVEKVCSNIRVHQKMSEADFTAFAPTTEFKAKCFTLPLAKNVRPGSEYGELALSGN
ncbi:MAG: hypothetical protein ACOCZX_02185, partial [Candidatus Bipolaricaulota bacterium]